MPYLHVFHTARYCSQPKHDMPTQLHLSKSVAYGITKVWCWRACPQFQLAQAWCMWPCLTKAVIVGIWTSTFITVTVNLFSSFLNQWKNCWLPVPTHNNVVSAMDNKNTRIATVSDGHTHIDVAFALENKNDLIALPGVLQFVMNSLKQTVLRSQVLNNSSGSTQLIEISIFHFESNCRPVQPNVHRNRHFAVCLIFALLNIFHCKFP